MSQESKPQPSTVSTLEVKSCDVAELPAPSLATLDNALDAPWLLPLLSTRHLEVKKRRLPASIKGKQRSSLPFKRTYSNKLSPSVLSHLAKTYGAFQLEAFKPLGAKVPHLSRCCGSALELVKMTMDSNTHIFAVGTQPPIVSKHSSNRQRK
jgi:hypothetical protein